MKTSFVRPLTFGTLLLSLGLTSCADPYGYGYGGGGYGYNGGYGGGYGRSAANSTVAGALIGAGAGGIIGNQRHRGLEGAAIGGVLGALAGSMIGNSQRGYPQQGCYSQPGYSQPNCAPGYNRNLGYGFTQPNSYYPTNGYANGFGPQPGNNPYAFGTWQ